MEAASGPLVFVHLQKTGGQTIRQILRNHFGTDQCDLQDSPRELTERDLRYVRFLYPNLRCLTGHACMPWNPTGSVEGARYFTFLRKPVERTVSAYLYLTAIGKRPQDFRDWIEFQKNRQVFMLGGEQDLDAAITCLREKIGFIGLQESFDESLVLWKDWLDLPELDIRYRKVNVSKNRGLKEEILGNEEWMGLIREHTSLDEELYRIAATELYPAQVENYGGSLSSEVEAFRSSLVEDHPDTLHAKIGRLKRNLLFRPAWKLFYKR